MAIHLQRAIEKIKKEILSLGAMVEERFKKAVYAIVTDILNIIFLLYKDIFMIFREVLLGCYSDIKKNPKGTFLYGLNVDELVKSQVLAFFKCNSLKLLILNFLISAFYKAINVSCNSISARFFGFVEKLDVSIFLIRIPAWIISSK